MYVWVLLLTQATKTPTGSVQVVRNEIGKILKLKYEWEKTTNTHTRTLADNKNNKASVRVSVQTEGCRKIPFFHILFLVLLQFANE